MFGASSGSFTRLVEKATSQLLLEPDWDSILQICDCIRQGDVQAKFAVQSIRKKIQQDNPHVSLFALGVIESCVKNCGESVHEEVATKDFMEFCKELTKKRQDPVKAKILELIQVWAHAFRNEPSYKVVQDTFHLLKMEGHTFPTLKEADAMFKAERAPEWKDGECCHRCRVQFSTFQRKHHCRHCGNIFCSKCSSKSSIIPKFGLEREVRVCEACFDDINKGVEGGAKKDEMLPKEYLESSLAHQPQTPPSSGTGKSEQEVKEEEELQLAIALSKSEAEAKEKQRSGSRVHSNYYGGSNDTGSKNNDVANSQPTKVTAPVLDTSDMDPELARYLNRNYWEQRGDDKSGAANSQPATTQPSAPTATAATTTKGASSGDKVEEKYQNGDTGGQEEFLNALRSSIEIFVNRMKSNSARGRSIATDSSVQSLFAAINQMHPQLMKNLSELEDGRSHYESLQDQLAQLKDAREALDALREEHRDKRRREQEELERQRQIQMAHKLDVLRQKKQEYLEYQRQMALQRMQEQEREMQMRFEQQKQFQHMRAMQYGYQMYPQQPQSFSPGGSAEGSPLHQQQQQQQPASLPGSMGPAGPGGVYPTGMTPGAPGQTAAPGLQQVPMYGQPAGYTQPPGAYTQQAATYPATSYPAGQFPPGLPNQAGPGSGAAGLPPGQPPVAAGLPPGQPPITQDYNSFNMQGVSNSLPAQVQTGGPPAPNQQQPYLPPPGPPGGQQYLPPGAQPIQQQLPQQQLPPQQQQQPGPQQQQMGLPQQQPQQQPLDSQLISFD